MAARAKAVVNADRRQLVEIEQLVRRGAYASTSQFVREALDEKLERLREARLREQVARYATEGLSDEDENLVSGQAFETTGRRRARAPR